MSRAGSLDTARVLPRRAAIRVDASAEIGSGHLTRSTALALALQEIGINSTFVCSELPDTMERALEACGFSVVRLASSLREHASAGPFGIDSAQDGGAVCEALRGTDVDVVIVDRYGIDHIWHRALRSIAPSIVAIDDLADRRFDVDLVINQNPSPNADRYAGLLPSGCRRLLGPRFALLRPEFAELRASPPTRIDTAVRRVVLFAGGGDPDNATDRVLEAWVRLVGFDMLLDVVIGSEHPYGAAIRQRCAKMHGVTLHMQTDRMASLLARADLLIGAAGSVSWERCCLGVPALMFSIADNQDSNLRFLAAHRTGIGLGSASELEPVDLSERIRQALERPRLLKRMARRAASLVDGLGARRAALAIGGGAVALRDATQDDALRVWPWRNDAATRRFFRDSRALTLAEHEAWWARTLRDDNRRLHIAHCGGLPVGVLRFDVRGETAEVSIYVDPLLTGLGLGRAMLRAGQAAVGGMAGVTRFEAEILPHNKSSEAAFAAVGFARHRARWVWEADR